MTAPTAPKNAVLRPAARLTRHQRRGTFKRKKLPGHESGEFFNTFIIGQALITGESFYIRAGAQFAAGISAEIRFFRMG